MAQKDQDKTPETAPETTEQTAPVNTSGQPKENPTENQEGAPEEAIQAVAEAQEKGFLGDGVAEKADYSQANSAVMNGGK